MIDYYLAGPYSHPCPGMRERRHVEHCRAAAWLMRQEQTVFSPIAHSHAIAQHGRIDALDADFWLSQDYAILPHCRKLAVLMIDGWTDSKGTQKEIHAARKLGLEVWGIVPVANGYQWVREVPA